MSIVVLTSRCTGVVRCLKHMSQLLPYSGGHAVAPYSPVPGPQPEGHDFQRLFAALRKRWRVFAAVAGGFILLVCGVTLLMPKSYTTTVSLLVGRPGAERNQSDDDTALPVLNALVLQSGAQSAETLAQLAHQQDLAADVIGRLSLKTSPGSLLGRVSVKPVVNTALLNLSVSWKTPEVSAQIANAFADAFVDRERDFVRSEAVPRSDSSLRSCRTRRLRIWPPRNGSRSFNRPTDTWMRPRTPRTSFRSLTPPIKKSTRSRST